MAVSPLPSGIPAGIPVVSQPGVKPLKTTLNQSDFLRLMTAQLKYQDPTNPVDNSEYVAQLAQFSMVSGVAESNQKLGRIADSLDALTARLIPAATATQPPATES